MTHRYVLYAGYALLVVGAIFIGLASRDGIFVGSSLLGCTPTAEIPFPPVELGGILEVRVYGLYDQCNYVTIHPWLTGGLVRGLFGGGILGGDHIFR